MDFWSQVWKQVWEMAFFGLKLGLDSEMRVAQAHQKFQGVPPPLGFHLNVEGVG